MTLAAQAQALFSTGRAIDLVLAFMAAEFAILYWRRRERRKTPIDLLLALAPGACLLLAVRAALTGAGWMWIAAFLAASLPAHLADLSRRRF
jgi:hypothetical protein